VTVDMNLAVVLVVVLGVGFLLYRALRERVSATADFSVGQIFKARVGIGEAEAAAATKALEAATRHRGGTEPEERGRVDCQIRSGRLSRVLWVDDHPDNNVYETLALEHLGFVITKATSTEAALMTSAGSSTRS